MLGKTLLLSLIAFNAVTAISETPAADAVASFDPDLVNKKLDDVTEDNCGKLIKDAMNIVKKDEEKFGKVHTVLTKAEKIGCKVIMEAGMYWARLSTETKEHVCKALLPIDPIAVLHLESSKHKHLSAHHAHHTVSYTGCEEKPMTVAQPVASTPEEQVIFTPEEIDMLTVEYVNNAVTVKDTVAMPIDNEEKQVLLEYELNSPTIAHSLKEIKGMTPELEKELEEIAMSKLTTQQSLEILANHEMQINRVEAKKETAGEDKTADTETVAEDKVYLSPTQISSTAIDCTPAHIEEVRGLYYAAATRRQVKPFRLYHQNITECVVGNDGHRFKAVIKINKKACLFNLQVEDNTDLTMLESKAIDLPPCHIANVQAIM